MLLSGRQHCKTCVEHCIGSYPVRKASSEVPEAPGQLEQPLPYILGLPHIGCTQVVDSSERRFGKNLLRPKAASDKDQGRKRAAQQYESVVPQRPSECQVRSNFGRKLGKNLSKQSILHISYAL